MQPGKQINLKVLGIYMKSKISLCIISFSCMFTLFGQNGALKPSMDVDGKISCGSKNIQIKKGYSQVDMVIDDTISVFGSSLFNFGKRDTSPCFFLNKKMKKEGNSIIWTSDINSLRGEKTVIGKYKVSLTLQEDNLVKLSCKYTLKPGIKLKRGVFYLGWRGEKLKGYYNIANKKIELDSKKLLRLEHTPKLSFTFSPQKASRKLRIIPLSYSNIIVNPKAGRIVFVPQEGNIEFLLDMRGEKKISRSSEYYGGIDFKKIDSLHLPQYKKSRNLIQNPSFESGLRYYGYKSYGRSYSPAKKNIYEVDNENAKFGNSSLRIKALKTLSLPIATFAIPFKPGHKYIFSFYAKGSLPKDLSLRIDGRATVTWWLFSKRPPSIKINNEWKRYNVSFTPLEEFYSLYFQGFLSRKSKDKEGYIWLDGLQLEEEKLTAYTEVPYSIQLLSSARGNFLDFKQKPNFKLTIKTKPEQSGSVNLSIKNFFSKEIFKQSCKFNADKNGKAVISLPELDKKILSSNLRGVFVAKTLVSFNGKDYRDYFRFSIMNNLGNKYKNKNIFCINACGVSNILCATGVDQRLSRLRNIGFGSTLRVQTPNRKIEKQLYSKIKEYNFADMGYRLVDKRKNRGTIQEDNIKMTNIQDITEITPEKLKKYEAICELKAKNRPWVTTWFFDSEIEGMKPLIDNPKTLGKILIATLKGIKKGNPKAKVSLGCGPWNIRKSSREWYARLLKAVNDVDPNIKFDSTGIHVYQQMPEHPDLDAATAAFIKILKPYGYENKPIEWDEGANYFEYVIPSKGMTPYFGNSGDKWYQGMLSYDMGYAERISAAFSARTWLVAFKYMKNIASLNDWSARRYFWDVELTVGAKMKVVNTIGRILGNANFYQDIRFAPECRSYIFIDDKKRPIAVIWGYDTAVDKGEKTPPILKFNFTGQKLEFLDLMETKREFPVINGFTQIPASPFPLFIIGEPGTEKLLAQSIAKGKKLAGSLVPLKVSVMPLNAKKAQVRFSNDLTLPLKAKASIKLNSVSKKYDLDLKAQAISTKEISLAVNKNILKKISFSVTVSSGKYLKKQKNIDGIFTFISERNIKLDGKADDWKNIPSIKLNPSTSVKLAIHKNTLYVAVQGSNIPLPVLLVNVKPTNNDWADFKRKEQDIYVYEMLKQKDNSLKAFTHYVPWVQADSGAWTPKAGRISKNISGRARNNFLEIAVSATGLMPLNLKKGDKFGLNIVFEKNKSILSLAKVKNYLNPKEPGNFKLLLSFID